MKSSHSPATVFAAFDEPNLIAHAGLIPAVRLAERCDLPRPVAEKVKPTGATNGAGTAADAKAMSIVAGMVAGADSIDDLDVLRHGGLPRLFGGVRAPSTPGSFLRAFTWGHVRQLHSATRAFTCNLAAHTGLVPKTDEVVFVDIDSKVKQVYGPAKQGASFGYTKVRGLHFQIVTVKTSTCAPVIVATRLREGSAGSGKGAASLLREALATVRAMGITAQIIVRADSAYFSHKVVGACRTAGARLSLAVAVKKMVREAIVNIAEDAWTPIKYTDAVWDDEEERWVCDAEIAEISFTAFTSKKKQFHTTARLIVRRVKRLNPKSVPEGQAELFGVWRHHVIFADSRFTLVQAEPMHREHAVVEQVFADLEDSALGHLPSGKFTANAAWLTLAATACNLTRAAGHLASTFHARARTGTIRRHLINIPARIATGARRVTLHLPQRWRWEADFTDLWTATGQRMTD
ncbi:IS1380 family transposase [Streptomyces sp. DSM 41972]|uniref:IS1380 family transposase n=1 Tax=Streptomyces althioticus subsp. attaecolombicae TaxID=3075534 RepID=A0ABU3I4D9_9ACTN|nr:IS1380 family transposase [Streptomyces sp. DSM 41972]SCD63176.1 Transposase DDE domain group 1 [Streptomyces sp. di50b]SCD65557.1 Transposase DDE domain group 1 [Streptomyces sp. di188]